MNVFIYIIINKLFKIFKHRCLEILLDTGEAEHIRNRAKVPMKVRRNIECGNDEKKWNEGAHGEPQCASPVATRKSWKAALSHRFFPNLNSPQGFATRNLWRLLVKIPHKSQPSLSHISFVDSRPPRWNNQMSWSPNPPDPTCANIACTLIRNPGISARLIPGPPGCGKSTMASLISKRENRVFYEGKLFRQEFIAGPKVWKLRFSRWWFPPGI